MTRQAFHGLRWPSAVTAAVLAAGLVGGGLSGAAANEDSRDPNTPYRIYMATWRGCEEVCQAFEHYVRSKGLKVEFIERSAGSRNEGLAPMVVEARQMRPDLIATWGTGVSQAFVGPYDAVDPAKHIIDIPVVYYYVTDPVGAKLAISAEKSGRPNVAGSFYSVSSETQLRAMMSYRPVRKLGLIYARDEGNSVAAADSMIAAAKQLGITAVPYELPLGANGKPSVADLPAAVAKMAENKVDFISFGSSSFLRTNLKAVTELSNRAGIPYFCPGESLLLEGDCLLGLTGSLRNIGQISAHEAYRILAEKATPGELATPKLLRFAMTVKMSVAKQLELYPPMTILRYAEFLEK